VGRESRIRAARAFDRLRFVPFVADGRVLGHVRRDHVEWLRRFADVFVIDEQAVGFRAELTSPSTRSEAMAQVARALAAAGRLSPWRGETYEIGCTPDGAEAAFVLERCAVRFFGFPARAVHVNGLTELQGRRHMWIARRSPTKAIDPGMLDNLVGGGVASGWSVEATLAKEAWEEAGIAQPLAGRARAAGTLEVLREVPDGLHAETIFVYDLALPGDFVPVNQDGEVAEFRCLALHEVAAELESDAPYTVDAGLVALECLQRLRRAPG
jgi:8-oxo-dGTP pyrophosphatase MutT (NUDIX family)